MFKQVYQVFSGLGIYFFVEWQNLYLLPWDKFNRNQGTELESTEEENDKITEEFWSPDPFQYSLFTKHKGLSHSADRKQVVSASLWKSTIYFAPRQPKLGRLAEPKLFTKR